MSCEAPLSPLTGSDRTTLIETVRVSRLMRDYRIQTGVDVARFFVGIETVSLYRCDETGYEFFWPSSVAGDEAFYAELGRHDWYYDPDRWEHRVATEWCDGAGSVLDVGCGSGAFLERMGARVAIEGIEANRVAVEEARARGLRVRLGTIEEMAKSHPASFDVVASFQVLEHLTDPRSFLLGMIGVAKPGGRILIGVPNNDGIIGETRAIPSYCLNQPPHHMGHWREASLAGLADTFGLELLRVEREPTNASSMERAAYGRVARFLGGGRVAGIAWRLGLHHAYSRIRKGWLLSLAGHTILAEFRRTESSLTLPADDQGESGP